MAETRELHDSQIVEDGPENNEAQTGGDEVVGAGAEVSAIPPEKPRARRTTVKDVENRTGDLEQRVTALTEQVAELNRRVEKLEADREQAQDGSATRNGGAALAEQVRQLDERLQKLANILTQQAWGVDRG